MVDGAKIARLRERGLTQREIAAQLGTSTRVVGRRLNPELAHAQDRRADSKPGRNKAKRQWEDQHDRRPCPQCGNLMSVGNHRTPGAVCVDCKRAERRAAREAREDIIERLYHEGASYAQIAQEIHSTPRSVNTYIAALRKRGRCLPVRRRVSQDWR